MRKGVRQIRPCKYNCGRPCKEVYKRNGRFAGYLSTCGKCQIYDFPDLVHKVWGGKPAHNAKPVGTRRTAKTGYVQIKITGSQRWVYEHRLIMETLLGRKLGTLEHVHHLNGNKSDNSSTNLVVLLREVHPRAELKACPICGKLHRCIA